MRGVIVFVKNPELGKVKTRLAATLGDEKALEIYLKLLYYTRDVLMDVKDAERYVYYSSFIDNNDKWPNQIFEKRLQQQGDLGNRITSAFQAVFESCEQVVIIGSDCPQLTAGHIQDAFQVLESNDVVMGPSHDGGYYLLGIKEYYPALFQEISWSTDKVFEETLQVAKQKNLKVGRLEVLTDIDYAEDWEKYGF
ncbi:MAG: TIGR04282 family arsenosugar biosynthesis glycosyltransferase [Bacteroidota bacterium]